jgi:hypothetical protein
MRNNLLIARSDNEAAANNMHKKQRVEEPRSSNYGDLRTDLARAYAKMRKQFDRKFKEYQWLCARTDRLEETDEEREAITKKAEEIEELSDKMLEVLECLTALSKKQKASMQRKAG